MSHETPLPQCEKVHKDFEKHLEESIRYRSQSDRHDEQILTLNKSHEQTMRDISEIKTSLVTIDKKVDEKFNELKIWILSSAVAGLITLLGVAMYYGGDKKQIEIDAKRIDIIETKVFQK